MELIFRYLLIISYDGTKYAGLQTQQNAQAIQPLIEKACLTLVNSYLKKAGLQLLPSLLLFPSGRTDAGVHAKGQTAHFSSPISLNIGSFVYGLNSLLPSDIRILHMYACPPSFHARFQAHSKWYRYTLQQGSYADPFQRHYALYVPYTLDIEEMQKAALLLEGKHDFRSLINQNGLKREDTTRTIFHIHIKRSSEQIFIDVWGKGFLYKMVRNIAGLLLQVGKKNISLATVEDILHKKERTILVPTAPAKGLCLMRVYYEEERLDLKPPKEAPFSSLQ